MTGRHPRTVRGSRAACKAVPAARTRSIRPMWQRRCAASMRGVSPSSRRRRPSLPARRWRRARYCRCGVARDQHPLRRPCRWSWRSSRPRLAGRRPRRPSIAFVAGESGRRQDAAGRRARACRARRTACACSAASASSSGEGELPYAPIVAALRPLARSGDPALDALSPGRPRRASAHLLPGLGARGAHAPDESSSRPGARVRGPARAVRPARPRGRAAADDRGPALGRPLDARVPRLPRLRRCAASACWSSPPTGPDELHRRHPLRPLLAELERDARARRVELRPAHPRRAGRAARGHPGRAPPDRARRPPVRPLGGQPAVRRGAAGRRAGRPRHDAADAARRADAAHRAPERRRRRSCCGCWPPGAGSTTRCWPRRRAWSRARCATRSARPSPRT